MSHKPITFRRCRLGRCVVAAALALGMPCTSIVGRASDSADSAGAARLPVPDAARLSNAERLVRQVYPIDRASRSNPDRVALARRLLKVASETSDDPAARFVLLREARDLAAAAGDAGAAMKAIEQMSRLYSIEPIAMTFASLSAAERSARDPRSHLVIARCALRCVDQAILAADFAAARRLVAAAESCAGKARDAVLKQSAQDRLREINSLAAEHDQLAHWRQRLAEKSDDAEANGSLGRHLCLTRNDWLAGAPMVARGPECELRSILELDTRSEGDASSTFQVANRWWDFAETQSGIAQMNLRRRAAEGYRRAHAGLSGLNRDLADQRIRSIEEASLRARGFEPGLVAELFKGADFASRVKVRVDPAIDFDWGEAAPDEALTRDNFALRWSGSLRVRAGGQYALTVIANMGVRLWIDDKLLIDRPRLSISSKGATETVTLAEGMHTVRLEYWDTTGVAKAKLHWAPPGVKSGPIPPDAFWHDPSWDLP